jgi:hypothetical protein
MVVGPPNFIVRSPHPVFAALCVVSSTQHSTWALREA